MYQPQRIATQYDDFHDIERSILEEFENSYESNDETNNLRTELEKTKKELYYLRKKYEEKNKDIKMLVTVLSHSLQNKQNIYDKMQKIAEIVNEITLDYQTPPVKHDTLFGKTEDTCKKSRENTLKDVKQELFTVPNNEACPDEPLISLYNNEFAEYYDQFNFETFDTPIKPDRHDYNLWWGTPPGRPVRQTNRTYYDDCDWRSNVNEFEPLCESMLSQYYSAPTTPEKKV
jgi:hypothetical protein